MHMQLAVAYFLKNGSNFSNMLKTLAKDFIIYLGITLLLDLTATYLFKYTIIDNKYDYLFYAIFIQCIIAVIDKLNPKLVAKKNKEQRSR